MANEDEGYLAWVRNRPCCRCMRNWPSEAHHTGRRPGIALKAHDHSAIPLCRQCHRDWHAAAGQFRDWAKAQRQQWAFRQILFHRRQHRREAARMTVIPY